MPTDHAQFQRMQERYDDLRAEGKHGHYECMFRVWREEFEIIRQSTTISASDCATHNGPAIKMLPCPFCGSSNIDPEGWCWSLGWRGLAGLDDALR